MADAGDYGLHRNGYSGNAFKKLGQASRLVDAGSWALSGALMILAQWVFG